MSDRSILRRIFSFRTLSRVILYFWCAFSVYAFAWIFISSLKTNNEFFRNVWGWPEAATFANYGKVLTEYNLGMNFANSLLVVGAAVVGLLVVSAPAAYVLSRIPFKGSKFMNNLFTLGMGVPYQLLLVPLFFLLFSLKLVNSLWGVILLYIALSIPFTVFMMKGYFVTLPRDLEEAAMIDGSHPIGTFFRVMLPLGQPALITAGIFNFIWLWNEFLIALTFLKNNQKFTLSVGLYGLQGSMQYTGDWVSLMAGFMTVALPTLLIYVLLSRRVIEGLTLGAVKD